MDGAHPTHQAISASLLAAAGRAGHAVEGHDAKRLRTDDIHDAAFAEAAAVAAGQLGLTLPLSAQSLLASLPGLHFTEGQPPLDPEVLQQHVALLAEHFPGFDGLGADSAAAAAAAAAAVEEAPAVAPAGMGEASGQGQDALTRSRAEATKEKNRRAQQRFRAKQKSRLSVLEAEVARLRGMLLESGIDPGEGAAGPLQLVNPDGTSLAPTPAQPPAPEPAQSSQPEQPEQPGMPMVLPSLPVEAMFAQLEHWLELCPGLPPGDAVHYLQVWASETYSDETRRLHYQAVQKRAAAGNADEVKLWVALALGPGNMPHQ